MRDVVETSARLGLEVLTLYAFSVENWKRPKNEVGTLMLLLKRYLRGELRTMMRHNIRFNAIGRIEELSRDVQNELRSTVEQTSGNTGMLFNIATNGIRNMAGYGTQISVDDRWAIAAYIRALQLSQGARVAEVPGLAGKIPEARP